MYDSRTSDEFVSLDKERPSIFENFINSRLPRGTIVPDIPMFCIKKAALPFDMHALAYAKAVGFVDKKTFSGTFQIQYSVEFDLSGFPVPRGISPKFQALAHGTFGIRLR